MSDTQHDRPLTSAERMRLTRWRRRNGMRSISIDIRNSEIEELVTRGYLKVEARDDPGEVAEALSSMLDDIFDIET